jgi:two-component system sensor histidine kinase DesK
MRLRLLPDNPEIGWTPYLWLVYLTFFVAPAFTAAHDPLGWTASGLAVALFLYLYLRSFWLRGRDVLLPVGGMVLLGALFLPLNPGASVFYIYAAGSLGFVGPPRVAVRWLLLVVALIGVESWLADVPPWGWIPGVLFSLVIGAANIHFGEAMRTQRALNLAHDEIARLAQLAERERIARDLHDLLGHTLSLITLKAELAGRLVARDPGAAAVEIREVERISREALAEVREAVRGYRGGGLAVELANARLALGAAGVELREDIAPLRLPAGVETVFALALREAVTNVVRHAGARHCRVALSQSARGEEVVLEVSDDGRGGAAAEGAGLAGMRERAAALGGRLERDGVRGTALRLALPLTPAPAPPALVGSGT